MKDPDGAYAQLIRLQEVNKESEQIASDQNRTKISPEFLRQASQRGSKKVINCN